MVFRKRWDTHNVGHLRLHQQAILNLPRLLKAPRTIPRTALADFDDKVRPFLSHLPKSRSPKSATLFYRDRRYQPPFILKSVAVAEVGDTFLSRSPIPAALYFEICRGRRSGRHFFVAVADTGRPSLWNLSRSPKSATHFCRGRRYRPPLILKFVAVAEEGDTFLSRSPSFANREGDKMPLFVAVRRFFFSLDGTPM